ncbi:Lipopolysaccharide-modifying protein [Trinorchestia longiramus]|nr:Lipopolysaccharide-modifying protein [Trinorchestia longiramus]
MCVLTSTEPLRLTHRTPESCDANGSTECGESASVKLSFLEKAAKYKGTEHGHDHWSYLQLIHDANQTFVACAKNCSCHYPQINADLLPFKEGISQSTVKEARKSGTLYQIIGGQVYREQKCMFPSRCAGIEHFLNEIADSIRDTEFVVNVRDWPQVYSGTKAGVRSPVFSFSRQKDVHGDILYPAWSFWEGGPAISLHPTGLGRWDIRRKTINKAAKKHPWSKKEKKAFFRGSRTSSDRDSVVLLSRERPDLVNASYTKNQAWKSPQDTLNAEPAPEVSLENHCQYKYLFNFHGVAASFRFKHLFLCGSLVLHEADDWVEFFYPQMKPWIHYVPFPPRASVDELRGTQGCGGGLDGEGIGGKWVESEGTPERKAAVDTGSTGSTQRVVR